ncbi:IS3 family transposase [Burkholderia stagnalis]|uniref:IS3 family transposase n=1 Tax=Burkholderia stagnalis TaxID=1503054 RepID=UPI000F814D1A|nr:IS3 family transposase [Burkholderia stagnalis]
MSETGVPRRQYTEEFKSEAVKLAETVGQHEAAHRLGVPVATLGNWSRGRRRASTGNASDHEVATSAPARRAVSDLEAENSRLRKELASAKLDIEILPKGDGILREGVAMRYAWIDQHRDRYSVSRLCRVLAVSRSGYCQWRGRAPSSRSQADAALDAAVAAIHRGSRGSYGRPRIVRQLHAQGQRVSAERVRRSLQRQGLRPVYKRPYRVTTDSTHRLPVAPNLLERRFDGWRPNQAWVSDITFVRTGEGWLYLAAILDLASRRIVGWSMSERINADLVCQALRSAYWQRKPPAGLLLHSDRGSQYASRAYRKLAASFGMTISMSRRANAWDNAPMESFFKTLKVERIYQTCYETRAHARLDIVDWIEGYYNRQRLHTSIDCLAPVDYEARLNAA